MELLVEKKANLKELRKTVGRDSFWLHTRTNRTPSPEKAAIYCTHLGITLDEFYSLLKSKDT
jgi:hypothetical protein